jgi:hypothetical protein
LCGYCAGIVRVLCGYCAGIVRVLCGYCAGIVRVLCGYCADIVRILCGYCADIVRILCGLCVGLALGKKFKLVISRTCVGFEEIAEPGNRQKTRNGEGENAQNPRTEMLPFPAGRRFLFAYIVRLFGGCDHGATAFSSLFAVEGRRPHRFSSWRHATARQSTSDATWRHTRCVVLLLRG